MSPSVKTNGSAAEVRRLVWLGGSKIELESRPRRALFGGEVRVRVLGCGLCGSDLHMVDGTLALSAPRLMGHEGVGVVEEIGPAATGIQVGTHVCMETTLPCDTCWYCRNGIEGLCESRIRQDGAFADEVIAPVRALHPIPPTTVPRLGVLAEPLGCALHGVERCGLQAGASVAIVGGGTMGLLSLLLARHMGAALTIMVTRSSWKRDLAAGLGADLTIDPTTEDTADIVRAATGGRGVDLSIEAAGAPQAVADAIALPRRGGSVLLLGAGSATDEIALRPTELMMRDLTIRGSYVRNYSFPRAIELLPVLDLEPLLTHEVDLAEIETGFELLRSSSAIKVLVKP